MKKLSILLSFNLITLISLSQNEKAKMYLQGSILNQSSLNLNSVLKSNSLNEANLNRIEIAYGFQYCPKTIGLFGECGMNFNTGQTSFLGQTARLGLIYRATIVKDYSIGLKIYYGYSSYNIRANTKSYSADTSSLLNANGGILSFLSTSSNAGTAVTFNFSKRYSVCFGAEISLNENKWKLQNNTIEGLKLEKFQQFYMSLIYNFKVSG